MLETLTLRMKRSKEVEPKITHFRLQGLLPQDQALALNLSTRTLSLLAEGPQQIMEQQFSANEMRMIIPIIESFPHYCPYEVLLTYISTNNVTPASIARNRQCLQEALHRGTWQQELRPVRRALSSLRTKLHDFNLEISTIRQRGCSITSLNSLPKSLLQL